MCAAAPAFYVRATGLDADPRVSGVNAPLVELFSDCTLLKSCGETSNYLEVTFIPI